MPEQDQQNAAETAVATTQAPAGPPARDIRITVDQLAQLPESEEKKRWISSLMQAEVARQYYAQDRQYAMDAYNSGQYDDLKKLSPQQGVALAITKLQTGRNWGFNQADSLRSIYFVGGRPAVENDLVASKLEEVGGIRLDPEFDYEDAVDEKGRPWKKCVSCTCWPKRWNPGTRTYVAITDRHGDAVSVSFGQSDADHAQIWEGGKQIPLSQKWNFKSWAKDMYYWKCVARVKKFYAPGVLRGATIREEALLETVATEGMPAELLPPDMQPNHPAGDQPLQATVEPPETPTRRPSVRERVLEQESFLDKPGPAREPGDGE